jgi:glycosyltransferase involved in cell wall biosynthesis
MRIIEFFRKMRLVGEKSKNKEMKADPKSNLPITLLFVTIGRNQSVKRFVISVRRYFPNLHVIAVDQNSKTDEMIRFYEGYKIRVIWVPFDCGLSYARNRGIEEVETPYALLADDDFIFTEKTNVQAALDVLENDPELGFIGGSIIDIRTDPDNAEIRYLRRWEKFFLICERTKTLITIPIDYLPLQTRLVAGHTIYLCDMTSNWGLFRMKLFDGTMRWDEDIKINGEHEDFFLSLKENCSWRVGYLPRLQCDHQQTYQSEYHKLRSRQTGRSLFGRKWGFSHHLELGVGLRDFGDYLAFLEIPLNYQEVYDPDGEGNVEFLPGPSSKPPGE